MVRDTIRCRAIEKGTVPRGRTRRRIGRIGGSVAVLITLPVVLSLLFSLACFASGNLKDPISYSTSNDVWEKDRAKGSLGKKDEMSSLPFSGPDGSSGTDSMTSGLQIAESHPESPEYESRRSRSMKGRSVVGKDDRTRVVVTTASPFSGIAHLEITCKYGPSTCSGVLIDYSYVLTAASCVFLPKELPKVPTATWVDSIYVSVARNGNTRPYGRIQATAWHVPPAYIAAAKSGYSQAAINSDYALLRLATPIPKTAVITNRKAGPNFSGILNVAGYPAEKSPAGTLWKNSCRGVVKGTLATATTTCDGSKGQTGGPAYSIYGSIYTLLGIWGREPGPSRITVLTLSMESFLRKAMSLGATSCGTCSTNGICTSDGNAGTCSCKGSFAGFATSCPKPDCAVNNGGCSIYATCGISNGAVKCTCKKGFTGNGITCTPTNTGSSCSVNNGGCSANATCSASGAVISCSCKTGFTGNGTTCTPIAVDLCASVTCPTDSTCVVASGTTFCVCKTGSFGSPGSCKLNNPCKANNGGCSVNGVCSNPSQGVSTCACKTDYVGNGSTCVFNPCTVNNGGCATRANCTSSLQGVASCACWPGYYGDGKLCADRLYYLSGLDMSTPDKSPMTLDADPSFARSSTDDFTISFHVFFGAYNVPYTAGGFAIGNRGAPGSLFFRMQPQIVDDNYVSYNISNIILELGSSVRVLSKVSQVLGATPTGYWTHYAVSRCSGQLRIFANGWIVAGPIADSTVISSGKITVGADPSDTTGKARLVGYLEGVQYLDSCIYDGSLLPENGQSFVPPDRPGTFGTVSSLAKQVFYYKPGLDMSKESSTAVFQAAWLVGHAPGELLSQKDYSIQFYLKPVAAAAGKLMTVVAQGNVEFNFEVAFPGSSYPNGGVRFTREVTVGDFTGAWAPVANVWTHYAISRCGLAARLFVNGTVAVEFTNVGSVNSLPLSSISFHVGAKPGTTANRVYGYIEAVQVTNYCEYEASFEPPAMRLGLY